MSVFLGVFFSFVLGSAVGSFLNVVVYRLPRRRKIVNDRSICPNCKRRLRWFELIPLFSFAVQRGKCRRCRKKISWQYPLVEAAAGLVFVGIFWRLILLAPDGIFSAGLFSWSGLWLSSWTILWAFYAAILIIVFVYDLKYYLIPDRVIFPAIIAAFSANIVFDGISRLTRNYPLLYPEFGSQVPFHSGGLTNYALSGAAAAFLYSFFFFILYWISRGRWIGFGDVKLAIFLGLILGFPAVVWSAFWAFLAGSIVGVSLIILKRKGFKSEIPFGPFLCFGTWLTFLFGHVFFHWYYNLPFTLIDYVI